MEENYWLHAPPSIPPEDRGQLCLLNCRLTATQKKSGRCEEYKYLLLPRVKHSDPRKSVCWLTYPGYLNKHKRKNRCISVRCSLENLVGNANAQRPLAANFVSTNPGLEFSACSDQNFYNCASVFFLFLCLRFRALSLIFSLFRFSSCLFITANVWPIRELRTEEIRDSNVVKVAWCISVYVAAVTNFGKIRTISNEISIADVPNSRHTVKPLHLFLTFSQRALL